MIKGKPENFDPDYHKRLQANHTNGQQQQGQTSSTHIVVCWQLQTTSHNKPARFEQIKEENTSTIRYKLSSKKKV